MHHRPRRLRERDPHEPGRGCSPLELLFDLSFAVAFGVAGDDLAGLNASGHVGPRLLGFAFAAFAIVSAWISFTWFASAFDTDDGPFRLTTMVQMTGVIVLALGLPTMFASARKVGRARHPRDGGGLRHPMRVAMVFQWIRAFLDCPDRCPGVARYLGTLVSEQAGWVALGSPDSAWARRCSPGRSRS
ncbi:MAG: low temperature requirement protein A [Propionibacterium sp.]|nr:low temperature requirement protein A [Propionibacterium sp.]